ncbi:Putative membrane protein [Corynebacterium glyciniphilum AJ 3170]|uniref:Putative membrane protein n=2 Tax=Corynebacterium TaxID=1716 RepID=X5EAV6_9CORY|nr:Putative membrane protein [Corynebacterium glyciniphilum AJ 3170]
MGVRRFWKATVSPWRRQDRRGSVATAVVCTAVAVGLSGCSAGGVTGPAELRMADETSGPIYLGLTDDPVQHRLAESYQNAFAGTGRPVEFRDIDGADRLDLLHSGDVNVVLGCVGELLDVLDPVKGEELRGLYAEARDEGADSGQWRDIAHTTMFSALPTDLQASDPGEAVGCDDDSLPQNTVAVYRKTALERSDRRALNNVAGGVSSDDLAADGDDD